jgi:hypothetical protein
LVSRINGWETARELLWSERTVTIVASFLALAFSIRIAVSIRIALTFSIALGSISRPRLGRPLSDRILSRRRSRWGERGGRAIQLIAGEIQCSGKTTREAGDSDRGARQTPGIDQ